MTHSIDRCPVERIDVIRLANGQRVVLRPAREQDLQLHGAYFDGLSKESRYNRFFNPTPKITAKMLEHLLHADPRSHVALMAGCTSGDKEAVIAEARYKVAADDGGAEFALSVADQFHGLGLGKLLLDRLVCAASRAGLGRLAGATLATNNKMLRLARKAGFALTSDPELLCLVKLEKRLAASETGHPCQDGNASRLAMQPQRTALLGVS
jgi:GNAT superfamily N-acetyltransferase